MAKQRQIDSIPQVAGRKDKVLKNHQRENE